LETFWKHRDTESTERKTRGRRIRGGSEKQEEEEGVKSEKKRTEWKAGRKQGEKRGHASNVGCRALFLSLL
jgi:hypothetical protein